VRSRGCEITGKLPRVNRQRAFALLGVLAATFGLYRALSRAEDVAKEVHRRGWKADVGISALVAVAALVIALKKSSEVIIKVDEAFGAEATAG
jgi:hypothetical protein